MENTAGPNIEVQPIESMVGEPVNVRATGLRPGSWVKISLELTDAAGSPGAQPASSSLEMTGLPIPQTRRRWLATIAAWTRRGSSGR